MKASKQIRKGFTVASLLLLLAAMAGCSGGYMVDRSSGETPQSAIEIQERSN